MFFEIQPVVNCDLSIINTKKIGPTEQKWQKPHKTNVANTIFHIGGVLVLLFTSFQRRGQGKSAFPPFSVIFPGSIEKIAPPSRLSLTVPSIFRRFLTMSQRFRHSHFYVYSVVSKPIGSYQSRWLVNFLHTKIWKQCHISIPYYNRVFIDRKIVWCYYRKTFIII